MSSGYPFQKLIDFDTYIGMNIFSFRIDLYAAFIAFGFLLLFYFIKNRTNSSSPPTFYFSMPPVLSSFQALGRAGFAHLPELLYSLAFIFLILAFIDPHTISQKEESASTKLWPTKGVAIYLVLDQSGSMAERSGAASSKMELLKRVTETFVEKRPNDLIGLISFARSAQVLSPLTLDHDTVLDQIRKLHVVSDRSDDGTALGYAIYKTAHLIAATNRFAEEEGVYQIKSSVMVVVTDGFQNPNPLDEGNRLRTIGLKEAADYVKEQGIHLYIVNVDPGISRSEFAPHRRLFDAVTEMTGGKFYYVIDDHDLETIYAKINQLEKSDLPDTKIEQRFYRGVSLYPIFLGLALFLLISAWTVETLLLKRSP